MYSPALAGLVHGQPPLDDNRMEVCDKNPACTRRQARPRPSRTARIKRARVPFYAGMAQTITADRCTPYDQREQ